MNSVPLARRPLLAAAPAAAAIAALPAAAQAPRRDVLWIPGYRRDQIRGPGGETFAENRMPPVLRRWLDRPDVVGPGRNILLRVDLRQNGDAAFRRIFVPQVIHSLTPLPDGGLLAMSFYSRLGLILDPETGDEARHFLLPRSEEGWIHSGHACVLPGGLLAVPERQRPRPYEGDWRRHEGRIAIRDLRTLQPVAHIPSGGIGPHGVAVSPDGRTLAVANLGGIATLEDGSATNVEGDAPHSNMRPATMYAPAVSLIDLASGRPLDRLVPEDGEETRHPAWFPDGSLLVSRLQMRPPRINLHLSDRPDDGIRGRYPQDRYVTYMPIRQAVRRPGGGLVLGDHDPRLCAHTLEPMLDDRSGLILLPAGGSNRLLAFRPDGTIAAAEPLFGHGVEWPTGIADLGDRYAVTGFERTIGIYEKGTRRLVRVLHAELFGHSHIAAS